MVRIWLTLWQSVQSKKYVRNCKLTQEKWFVYLSKTQRLPWYFVDCNFLSNVTFCRIDSLLNMLKIHRKFFVELTFCGKCQILVELYKKSIACELLNIWCDTTQDIADIFSSPEPKALRWAYSIPMLCRPSLSTISKIGLADQVEILCGASMGRGMKVCSRWGRWAWVPDATYQVSGKSAHRFWRRFLKGFYHIWVWQQSWSRDQDPIVC